MLRILLNVATAGSLLLCVTTIMLWVRSYRVLEHVGSYGRGFDEQYAWEHRRSIMVTGGGVLFHANHRRSSTEQLRFAGPDFVDNYKPGTHYYRKAYHNLDTGPRFPTVDGELDAPHEQDIDGGHRSWFGFHGFKWCRGFYDGAKRQFLSHDSNAWWEVVVPLWSMALMTSLLPIAQMAAWVRRHRARRAASAGMCSNCGYDCRATPERCPECGRAFPAASILQARG